MNRLSERDRAVLAAIADCVMAGLIFVLAVGTARTTVISHGFVATGMLAAVASAPLVVRRRWPVAVLLVVEAATVVQIVAVDPFVRVAGFGIAVAAYTVATCCPRSLSSLLVMGVAAANTVAALVAPGGSAEQVGGNLIFNLILVGGSWAIGDNIRTRRAYMAALLERADRLERERTELDRRAVREERARIARELHDIVAHHISAISVQAAGAQGLVTTDPVRADAALGSIQQASREALREMRSMVAVLDGGRSTELEPQPGLAQLGSLVARGRTAGLDIVFSLQGAPDGLPRDVDVSAYRIAQEAVTNVLKHAPRARTQVSVRYGNGVVEVMVRNEGDSSSGAPSVDGGRGLLGMRERVAMFGGRLEAGPADGGGFVVHAILPAGAASA